MKIARCGLLASTLLCWGLLLSGQVRAQAQPSDKSATELAPTGISLAGTLHHIEEESLKKEVEAAGFKLQAQASFLRNSNDPRDRNTPEPPLPSDEFVLKFV